jgi:hypothetical protein
MFKEKELEYYFATAGEMLISLGSTYEATAKTLLSG